MKLILLLFVSIGIIAFSLVVVIFIMYIYDLYITKETPPPTDISPLIQDLCTSVNTEPELWKFSHHFKHDRYLPEEYEAKRGGYKLEWRKGPHIELMFNDTKISLTPEEEKLLRTTFYEAYTRQENLQSEALKNNRASFI
jgi:hypothetical protein